MTIGDDVAEFEALDRAHYAAISDLVLGFLGLLDTATSRIAELHSAFLERNRAVMIARLLGLYKTWGLATLWISKLELASGSKQPAARAALRASYVSARGAKAIALAFLSCDAHQDGEKQP